MCYHHFYHYQNHCCLAVKVGEAGPAWSTQSQAAPRVVCGLRSHRQPRAWCMVYAVTGSPACGAWSMQSQAAPRVVRGLRSHRQPHGWSWQFRPWGQPLPSPLLAPGGQNRTLELPIPTPPTPLRHPGPRGFPPRPAASGLSLTPATTSSCFCCKSCSCVEMNHFLYGYLG